MLELCRCPNIYGPDCTFITRKQRLLNCTSTYINLPFITSRVLNIFKELPFKSIPTPEDLLLLSPDHTD